MLTTLGTCVPYFPDGSQIGRSLLLLLIAKPVTYAFFALCFRYRVSTPRPLSASKIGGLAAVQTVAGLCLTLFIGFSLWNFSHGGMSQANAVQWSVLIAGRIGVSFAIGQWMVGLRSRRLLGWTISSVGIDLAFDFAATAAFFGSWIEAGYAGVALLAFLAPLNMIGRRPSLKARFLAAHICATCGYDLRGNVIGRCPECGRGARGSPAAVPPQTAESS